MASPSLTMAFAQDITASKVQAGSSNQEASKSEQPSKLPRGRKPSKSSKSPLKKNKPSQRGMSIAKLEKLLEEEKWGGSQPGVGGFPLHPHQQFLTPLHPHHQFQTPLHPHHQFQTSTLIFVAASSYIGSDFSRSSPSFMTPKVNTVGGAAACGNNVTKDWAGGMLETSCKEFSSIPKVMHQCHQYDAYCSKNTKCMKMAGMIVRGKEKLVTSMNNCHVLTGMNQDGYTNNVGSEIKDSNLIATRQICHLDSELMGIIREGSSFLERTTSSVFKEYEFSPPGKSLKEYEFFPGTSGGRSYTRPAFEQPSNYYTEAASSYLIPSSDYNQYNAASATNNCIDLSLRLSL